jgi:hypothetical protein
VLKVLDLHLDLSLVPLGDMIQVPENAFDHPIYWMFAMHSGQG